MSKSRLLKTSYLSSEDYQKVKNLKDFKKENYQWVPEKGLYKKID